MNARSFAAHALALLAAGWLGASPALAAPPAGSLPSPPDGASPPAPSALALTAPKLRAGPHPRLLLDAPTLSAMKGALSDPKSGASRAVALCRKAVARPAEMERAVYQGENWAMHASACALSYQLTGDVAAAEAGVKAMTALLDDRERMGDGKGGDDVVRHDSGYGIRFFAPYAALAYDWLHDAPPMTEALRARARGRFRAWLDWYGQKGYLPRTAGANYAAGFVFAKTFVAVAEAGEAPEAEARYWPEAAGAMLLGDWAKAAGPGGVLEGGDWPEGWQYGPLSVLEIALVARVARQQGLEVPALARWADDLALRYAYAVTPDGKGFAVGGDTEAETPFLSPPARPLLAAEVLGSDRAASWAAFLRGRYAPEPDPFPLFDALAEARGAKPDDPLAHGAASAFLARGTRSLYVKRGEGEAALWAVFRAAPQLVPDHQRKDAAGFELVRGGDTLIVDPSPYGARSTLMGNGLAIDSATAPADYSPTQLPEGKSELVASTATQGGVVAATADLRGAFVFKDRSDVELARREWVMLPEGDLVVIDRAKTGGPSLSMHVRFRSPAQLSLEGGAASGVAGRSKLWVRPVTLSGGEPEVRRPPVVKDPGGPPYNGDGARFPVSEYRVRVPGPAPLAVHAIAALGAAEAPPSVEALPAGITQGPSGPAGAVVRRGARATYVIGAPESGRAAELRVSMAGEAGGRLVVLGLAGGKASAKGSKAAGGCEVVVTPDAGSLAPAPVVFEVASREAGCAVTVDAPDVAAAGANLARVAPDDGAARGKLALFARRLGKKRMLALALGAAAALVGAASLAAAAVRRRHRAVEA